ncbi:hypothetical protein LCDVSa015L [Lymphocystis disease virus 3]|uniref:F-box domain-containing protein n=1 Tax=Lymphocystis disease virus 3 TaxID=2560566 RepID=A0A1B2RVT1_9VIRU|nr:hypothetical protein BZK12_gp015 [Lymphocystis disease virus Sa]AOC55099.1 hypothetical protein LCDVSa015L [Lymphocystis disease virus 3]
MEKFVNKIPLELKYKILKFLPFKTLMSLRLSNRMYWEINQFGRWNPKIDWLLYNKPNSMQLKGKLYVYSIMGPMSDFCFPKHLNGFFGTLTVGEYFTKNCSYTIILESPMLQTDFKFKPRTLRITDRAIERNSLQKFIGKPFEGLEYVIFYKTYKQSTNLKKSCKNCNFYGDKYYRVHRFTMFLNRLIQKIDDVELINKTERIDGLLTWSVIKNNNPIGIAVLCTQ